MSLRTHNTLAPNHWWPVARSWALALALFALLAAGCTSGLPDAAEVREAPNAQVSALADTLTAGVRDDPEDAEALRALALAEVRLSRTGDAVTHARRAAELEPFEASSHQVLGEAFEADGKLQRAQAAYAQAIALDAGHQPTYLRLARLQARLERRSEAMRTLERLLARDPESFDGLVLKAQLLAEGGDLDAAEEIIRRARGLRPDDLPALRQHLAVLRRQGRIDSAIRLAEQGLAQAPRDRDLLETLARLHRARAEWPAAQSALERLEATGPLSPELQLLRVTVLDGLGRTEAAQQALDALLRSHPDYAPGRVRQAERDLRAGRAEQALASARRAATLAPRDAEPHYWVAAASFVLGERQAGDAALELAEQAAPDRPAVRLLRVGRLLAGSRLEAAEDLLERLAADAPDLPAIHLYDSERLALRGELEAAGQVLLRLPPDFAPAHVGFARLRIDYLRGNWTRVVERAAALTEHPLLGWRATYLRAGALLQLGHWQEGATVIAPLVEGARRRVEFVYLAGYLKLLQGDRAGAQRLFLAGKALAPGSPLMIEALSRLALDAQDWARTQELLEQGLKDPGPYRQVFLERLGRVAQGRRSAELGREALVRSLAIRPASDGGLLATQAAEALNGGYIPDFGRLGGG